MTADCIHCLGQFLRLAANANRFQELTARGCRQPAEIDDRSGRLPAIGDVGNLDPSGD